MVKHSLYLVILPSPGCWQCRLAAWVLSFSVLQAQSDIQTVEYIPRQWAYAVPSRWVCAEHACLGRAQLMCWLKPTGPGIVLRSCFLCLHVKAPLSLWSITAGAKHRPRELARGKYAARTPRLQREAIMIAEERKKWSAAHGITKAVYAVAMVHRT